MHVIRVELPKQQNEIEVHVIADVHLSDPNCDIRGVQKRVADIAAKDNAYAILAGDLIDNATRSSIGDIYSTQLSPMEQIQLANKTFAPLKGRILCAVPGNHEERTYRADGIDITWLIANELGAGDRTIILSFGGSLGARRVNEVVADLCAWEQKNAKPVLHLHATGQYGVELFQNLEKEKGFAPGESLVVKEYINNMPELLAAADLVISRAGALTLAELEAVGRAAVLIPSPNVAENHQYYNALELQKAGAAVVIEEKDLTGEKLVQTVSDMLAQPGKLAEMGQNARKLSVDDSLDRIADALLKLVKTP